MPWLFLFSLWGCSFPPLHPGPQVVRAHLALLPVRGRGRWELPHVFLPLVLSSTGEQVLKRRGRQAESRADRREGVEAKQGCGGLAGGWLPVNVAGC